MGAAGAIQRAAASVVDRACVGPEASAGSWRGSRRSRPRSAPPSTRREPPGVRRRPHGGAARQQPRGLQPRCTNTIGVGEKKKKRAVGIASSQIATVPVSARVKRAGGAAVAVPRSESETEPGFVSPPSKARGLYSAARVDKNRAAAPSLSTVRFCTSTRVDSRHPSKPRAAVHPSPCSVLCRLSPPFGAMGARKLKGSTSELKKGYGILKAKKEALAAIRLLRFKHVPGGMDTWMDHWRQMKKEEAASPVNRRKRVVKQRLPKELIDLMVARPFRSVEDLTPVQLSRRSHDFRQLYALKTFIDAKLRDYEQALIRQYNAQGYAEDEIEVTDGEQEVTLVDN